MLRLKFSKLLPSFSFFSLLLIFCLTVTARPSFAQQTPPSDGSENFDIQLHSTYTVTATGKTIVEQKFQIKNKNPELFVSKYGIVVSSTNVTSVSVTHNGKNLEPAISKNKGQTSIGVTFEDKIVGEGKVNELIIHYSDSDIALISGKVLEVNIPKLSDHYQYQNYQLELRVPSIFDTPSRINPNDFTLKQEGDFNIITYSKLQDRSVSAIFGSKQLFDLRLNYYLNNPTSQNSLTQITLPPENPYQKVHYINLEPMPQSIKEDQDGNFIATYEVPANNSFSVELLAQVMLTLTPDSLVPFTPVFKEQLTAQKFWESGDPTVVAAAENLNSIESIYDFTVEKLNYTKRPLEQDFERLGAAVALKEVNNNDATCQEFTDLFVALARQKNIPARRVVGIAYSSNEELRPSNLSSDVLHTWPEYYDSIQQTWLRSDPTWEDTTGGIDYFNNFDLNHIALAINGMSSTLPYPAGSYFGSADEKDKKIYLEFSKEEFAQITPDFEINLIAKKFYGLAIPGNYDLQILNKTGRVWYFKDIEVSSEDAEINMDESEQISKILPFSKLVLPISVYNKNAGALQKAKIQVSTMLKEGQSSHDEFEVNTSPQLKINNPRQLIFMGGGLILLTLLAGSLFLLGRQLANSLRRKGQKLEEENHQLQAISTALKENQENDGTGPQSGTPSSGQRT